MKPLFIIILFLAISLSGQSQGRRNEIQIGYNGAEFFDRSPYGFNQNNLGNFGPRLNRLLPASISYTRYVHQNWGVGLDYGKFHFGKYTRFDPPGKRLLYPGEIDYRGFHLIQLHGVARYQLTRLLEVKGLASVARRYNSRESFFIFYNYTDGGFAWEPNFGSRTLNDWGAAIGFQIKVKVYKGFSLLFETRYFRFKSEANSEKSILIYPMYDFLKESRPNMMTNSLLLSYSFGKKNKKGVAVIKAP